MKAGSQSGQATEQLSNLAAEQPEQPKLPCFRSRNNR